MKTDGSAFSNTDGTVISLLVILHFMDFILKLQVVINRIHQIHFMLYVK